MLMPQMKPIMKNTNQKTRASPHRHKNRKPSMEMIARRWDFFSITSCRSDSSRRLLSSD